MSPIWRLSIKRVSKDPLIWMEKRYWISYATLTDLDSSCPRSLLKTKPSPPGYSWVSGGWYVTPEPRFSGLVLDHQGLEELELKKTPRLLFLIKFGFFERFFGSSSSKLWWSSTKPLNLGSGVTCRPPDIHGYPGGGFSNDPGQLWIGSVSVLRRPKEVRILRNTEEP